jgi:hypothetical protein
MVFEEAMQKYDAKNPWQTMKAAAHCAAAG